MKDNKANWEKFLSSKILKNNLISISLFIAAFELLKERIVDMLKTFFSALSGKSCDWVLCEKGCQKEVLPKRKVRYISHCCGSKKWVQLKKTI